MDKLLVDNREWLILGSVCRFQQKKKKTSDMIQFKDEQGDYT